MATITEPTNVVELRGQRVTLRGHRASDIPGIVAQCTDPASQQYTSVPRPYATGDAEDFIAATAAAWQQPDGVRRWAVEYRNDQGEPCFAGSIDLNPHSLGIAEIGFGLHPDARGKGLMSEAVRLACTWWFDQGGTRVHWYAIRGNVPSWRVAWACGFTYMGNIPGFRVDGNGEPREHWSATLGKGEPFTPKTVWFEAPTNVAGTNLTDGAVTLRPWRDDDAAHVGLVNAPTHHVPAGSLITPESFHQWLLKARERMIFGWSKHWCVADAHSDKPLGDILLNMPQAGTAELGFQVFTHAVGRGVASAASKLALKVAFTETGVGGLGLRKVTARCSTDNYASARALTKAGLMPYGTEAATDLLHDGTAPGLIHWQVLSPETNTHNAVTVVPLPATQWQRYRALRLRALAENPEAFCRSFSDVVAEPASSWQQDTARPGQFVAVVAGFDAGIAGVRFEQQNRWYVHGMWADPTCRGLGIGRRLLDACVGYVQHQHGTEVFLVVDAQNRAAIAVYEDYGFTTTGNQCRVGQIAGVEYRLNLAG